MFGHNILYEENVFVSIIRTESPYGTRWADMRYPDPGFSVLEIYPGYRELGRIEKILGEVGIEEKAFFYGMEEIVASGIAWRIFAVIKTLAPSRVQFYRLPPDTIHGVLTRIEI